MDLFCLLTSALLALVIGVFVDRLSRKPTTSRPENPRARLTNDYGDDLGEYPTTADIFKSGRFSASERRAEYRRRGKSPSGVIDGVYNDTFLEDGRVYNDMDRDWDADA
jgi:hypothetical protein